MSQTAKDLSINRAISFYKQGRVKKSLKETLNAKKNYPDEPFIYNLLGVLYAHIGSFQKSTANYSKAIKLNPEYFEAYNHAGVAYTSWKKNDKAIECFDRAIQINPLYPEAYNNKGNALKEKGEYKLAAESYEKSIDLNPNYIDPIANAGIVYDIMNDFNKAESYFNRALSLNPTNTSLQNNLAKCYYNKALTLTEADRIDEAEENYRKAIRLDPKDIGSYHNLALIHQERGQITKGLSIIKKVLELDVYHPDANHLMGIMSLQLGRFKEGWKYFEYRWEASQFNKVIWPIQNKPMWKGERGKHVALWREQGIGDDIIFLGLLPEVKEMCAALSVYVDPRLQTLCRHAMPDINFVKDIKELQKVECDYHLPLGSVPALIRNDISDFDRTVRGYLKADPKRVEALRKELQLGGKTVIGISWKSFKIMKLKKSIQLRDMERIFSGLDVVLVNLQYGDVEDEIREFTEATGIEVVQCASVDNREDLDGLAALIEVCDLVVSTSNVTVHLAGALAKETWVLLRDFSIYYWLIERTDSIWYPSLSLYRQPTLDDWDSVYGSIRKDLETRLQCN